MPAVDTDRKAQGRQGRPDRSEIDEGQKTLLGESLLFESLDEAGRDTLASGGIVHTHRSGEIILREGDTGDSLYVVSSGRVRLVIERDGAVIEIGTLQRPACFGEAAVFSGRPRAETVEAIEETRVVCYPRDHIEAIARRFPDVRKRIEAVVLGRAKAALHAIERRGS